MIIQKIKSYLQNRIDRNNKTRLTNLEPCLVCSNCTGGFLYHWLGLRFNSPFINLYLTPKDFVTALENWNEFISSPIIEIKTTLQYPIGQVVIGGGKAILIHFMHYPDYDSAITKWNERKSRMNMDPNKIGFMLTNWDGDDSLLERFDRLPYRHKVVFTYKPYANLKSAVYLKGFAKYIGHKNIFDTQKITGERYIDQYDYVSFINSLK